MFSLTCLVVPDGISLTCQHCDAHSIVPADQPAVEAIADFVRRHGHLRLPRIDEQPRHACSTARAGG